MQILFNVHVPDFFRPFFLFVQLLHLGNTRCGFFSPQYLESVRPLLDTKQYNQMEILANDFKESKAAQLQRYLILKSWWATNYVSSVQKVIRQTQLSRDVMH